MLYTCRTVVKLCWIALNAIRLAKNHQKQISSLAVSFKYSRTLFPMAEENALFNLAARVINHTNRHLFLTGRAGTGKTTFLRHIQRTTPKKVAVVAPTGVAAINAGGVTMHSLFQLPMGMYLADADDYFGEEWNVQVANRHSLFKGLRMRGEKQEVLRELELLVIDEVSMLRADMLDAIDAILRSVRRKPKVPFGGVQVLYIGDLFQLPPVLTNAESQLFYEHYKSPFFFDAKVVAEEPPLLIELKHIYRQRDEAFIHILNAIRSNRVYEEELNALHERYKPWQGPEEGMIVLTTHNAKADAINTQKLAALPGKTYKFEGTITGEFYEKALPVDKSLQLKIGTQIMFIKNDKGEVRRFYNGKIATVHHIGDEGDIWVKLAGNDSAPGEELLKLEQHTWKSIRYKYNREKNSVDEEELGSYKQYPVRLAWAITIHKSQGLTFERAIVDAGQSFAAGQVYVALSRLSSLEGLVLHSRIPEQGIEMPEAVTAFCNRELAEDFLEPLVRSEEIAFAGEQLVQWFSFSKLYGAWAAHHESYGWRGIPAAESAAAWSNKMLGKLDELDTTAAKFRAQLEALQRSKPDWAAIHARVVAARRWFDEALEREIMEPLAKHFREWSIKPRTKKYLAELKSLEAYILHFKKGWGQAVALTSGLAGGAAVTDIVLDAPLESSRLKEAPGTESPAPPKKPDTYATTLAMFREGRSIAEIAAARGLTAGTIEGHLARYVESGEVKVEAVMPQELVTRIRGVLESAPPGEGIYQTKTAQLPDVSYGLVRMVAATLGKPAAVKKGVVNDFPA